MAILVGVINCNGETQGTGTAGCVVNPNNINNLVLAKKGWSLLVATDTLDQETIDELVQKGILIFLPIHFNREDASEETQYETSESGIKIKTRDGLIEFVAQYAKGICFSKALGSLSSKKLDLLFTDYEDGKSRLWGAYNNGKFKGFDLSLNNAENFVLPTGTTGAKKPFRVQLSPKGTAEYNSAMNFLTSDELDFAEIEGINDVMISGVTNTVANFQVTANSACDNTTSFEGFDSPANWRITNNAGVVQSAFTVSYLDGKYKFSGLSAGTYNVQLYDSVAGSKVVATEGMYYQSDVLNVVVSA